MKKKEEQKIEPWQIMHVYPNQGNGTEYEPTEEELLDQFAKIISDMYLRKYHGIDSSEEESL